MWLADNPFQSHKTKEGKAMIPKPSCKVDVRTEKQNDQFYWVFWLFLLKVCEMLWHTKKELCARFYRIEITLRAYGFHHRQNWSGLNTFGIYFVLCFCHEKSTTFPCSLNNIWAFCEQGSVGSLREMSCGICGLVLNNFIQIKKTRRIRHEFKRRSKRVCPLCIKCGIQQGWRPCQEIRKKGAKRVFLFLSY